MHPDIRKAYILEGMEITEKRFSIFVHKHKLYAFLSKESLEDLKQDCMVEMIMTVDKFDVTQRVKLVTYLLPRIDGFLKDFVKKQIKIAPSVEMEKVLSIISIEIDKALKKDSDHTILDLEKLEVSEETIKELVLEMGYHPDSFEIFESLIKLPESRLKVLLGYYVMNKSVKELSKELGFSPDTGWVYRLKNEGIKTLKEMLREKGLI